MKLAAPENSGDKQSPGLLAVRSGSNPNSSSLGVNVTWLLLGGALAGVLALVGGTLARWVLSRRNEHEPGE